MTRLKLHLPGKECNTPFKKLLQGYKHSPMIAHAVLAELLQTVSLPLDMKLCTILIAGDHPEKVVEAATAVQKALHEV